MSWLLKKARSYRKQFVRTTRACVFVALSFLLFSGSALAEVSSNTWLMLNHDMYFSDAWSLHLDTTARQTADLLKHRQNVSRVALHRGLGSSWKFGVGYAFQATDNWNARLETPSDEHRIYEQIDYEHEWGSIEFDHRLRIEQRFRESRVNGSDTYQNRLRYQLKGRSPLSSKGDLVYSNEIFVHTGDSTPSFYSQNRLYLGYGFTISERARSKAEVGWIWQDTARGTNTPELTVHLLQLWISTQSLL